MPDINNSLRNKSPNANDFYYCKPNSSTPWDSAQQAHENIPAEYRGTGKKFLVSSGSDMIEYWYKGGLGVEHLVPVVVGGGGGSNNAADLVTGKLNDLRLSDNVVLLENEVRIKNKSISGLDNKFENIQVDSVQGLANTLSNLQPRLNFTPVNADVPQANPSYIESLPKSKITGINLVDNTPDSQKQVSVPQEARIAAVEAAKQDKLIPGQTMSLINGINPLSGQPIDIAPGTGTSPTTNADALTSGTVAIERLPTAISLKTAPESLTNKNLSSTTNTFPDFPQSKITGLATALSTINTNVGAKLSVSQVATINGSPITNGGNVVVTGTGVAPTPALAASSGTINLANGTVRRFNDIIFNMFDRFTGEPLTLKKVTKYKDGTTMTDAKLDYVIYFKGSTGEYFMRDYQGVLRPEWWGAKGDGVFDDEDAIDAAVEFANGNDQVHLTAGKRYRACGIATERKNMYFDGNGATIVQTRNNGVIQWDAKYEWQDTVTAVVGKRKITTTNAHNLKIGDKLKIVSDDQLYLGANLTRRGEFCIVKSVTDSRNFELANNLRETYTTTVRIGKMNPYSCTLKNINFDTEGLLEGNTVDGVTTFWVGHYCKIINGTNNVYQNITSTYGFGALIKNQSTFGYYADGIIARNQINDAPHSRFGYGFEDKNSCNGTITNSYFYNCRHGYTTNCDAVTNGAFELYGATYNVEVTNCFAVGSSNSGFDTHEEGYKIIFRNCHTFGSYEGTGAIGAGFTTRAQFVEFHDCTDNGSKYGFRIEGEGTNRYNSKMFNCESLNSQNQGILCQSSLYVKGGTFEAQTANCAILADSDRFLDMEDCTFIGGTSSTGANSFVILCNLATKITFKDITLDGSAISKSPSVNARFIGFKVGGYTCSGTGLTLKGNFANNELDYVFAQLSGTKGTVYVSDIKGMQTGTTLVPPAGLNPDIQMFIQPNLRSVTGSTNINTLTPSGPGEMVYHDGKKRFYIAQTFDSGNGYMPMGSYHYKGTSTYAPGTIANNSFVQTTVTVTGAALGMQAFASFSLNVNGVPPEAWVSAPNTVVVKFPNTSGAAVTLASGTITVRVVD